MKKLLQFDVLSIAFLASIVVFGTSVVLLLALDLSFKGQLLYAIFAVASFFSSLSLIIQLVQKRKKDENI